MVIPLECGSKVDDKKDLASVYFSDCIGFLTQNRFCDTQHRIDFDPSLVFFEKDCPYIA